MEMKLIVFFVATLVECYASRILFMHVVTTKSHKINYMPLAEALAARGHHVTVVNPFTGFEGKSQVHEINVKDITKGLGIEYFKMQEDPMAAIAMGNVIHTMLTKGYDSIMENEEFRRIISEKDVDLMVIDDMANDFVLPIADSLQIPFVFYCTTSAVSSSFDAMQIPKEYASVPNGMLPFDSNMHFFHRLINVLASQMFSAFGSYIDWIVDGHVKKDFPNARSASEIKRDASLSLINHPWVTAYPRPLPPNVIPIGPLHVRPGKPLPQDLQLLADESTDGFIVFSLGSYISGSSMPPHLLQVFQNAFSRLPQRVFWKWEADGDVKFPPNVVPLKWFPQQDLIAHPNCRLLISHGGLLGLQEAIYHEMPFLGLPFGGDQFGSIARAVKEGYAIQLFWNQVNEESLFDAISSLINEPSYKENALRVSSLMRDEILPAKDVAVYWIEHVLRHGGARHLQLSSRNLSFIQKHLIDVWLFIGAFLFVLGLISFLLLRCMLKCFRKPTKEKSL